MSPVLKFLIGTRKFGSHFQAAIGIAYAFLVLLPKLAVAQKILDGVAPETIYGFLVHNSYLVALLGLVIYFTIQLFSNGSPSLGPAAVNANRF